MPAPSAKLRAWVHKQVFNDQGQDAPCKLALYHLTAGKYGGRISTYPLPEPYENKNDGDEDDNAIDNLVDCIVRDAEHDNQSVSEGGSQRYALVAHSEEGEFVARVLFTASPIIEPSGALTDTPDDKGLMHQLMRHLETREKTATHLIGTMLSHMSRMLDTANEQNTRLQEERLEVMSITQKLLSEKEERELRREAHESKQRNVEQLMSNVQLFLPALAAKVTGQTIPLEDEEGNETSAEKIAVHRLLQSLTSEQRQALLQILTPEQMLAVAQLMPAENEA
jgi:hypothetical protein